MAFIDRKTMLALIDATGFINVEKPVGIKYVKKDGSIGTYQCRKYVKHRAQGSDQSMNARGKYMIRDRGLIKILDLETNQIKNLFIFAIIGFNPQGNLNYFHTVQHG